VVRLVVKESLMAKNGMEKRNGAWTSQTFTGDASSIRRLAAEIEEATSDPSIRDKAKRIQRLARGLEDDL
jgi:hypothetical protein